MPNRKLPALLPVLVAILTVATAASTACAQDRQAAPALSVALRAALEKEAPAAVEKRFKDALTADARAYEVDAQALNALGAEYLQKGEMEKGMAVLAVTAHAMQLSVAGQFPAGTNPAGQRGRADRNEAVGDEARARQRALDSRGPARPDLERFHGLFALPGAGPERALFLVRNCDRHLTMGPTWADTSPWILRSRGDTTFEYPGDDFQKPIRVSITTDADGRATAISHDVADVPSPLVRSGDLPAGFAPVCGGG